MKSWPLELISRHEARKTRKKPNKKRFKSRPMGKKLGGDASPFSYTRLPTYGDVFRVFYTLSTVTGTSLFTIEAFLRHLQLPQICIYSGTSFFLELHWCRKIKCNIIYSTSRGPHSKAITVYVVVGYTRYWVYRYCSIPQTYTL